MKVRVRKTNCKRMTRMMSLYVAGDLVGEPEREAGLHLAACEECRQLAEEFSESSSLLTQACAPPEFGAEFYTGIRRAVLGKVTAEGIVSKPSPFGRRWLYAASFAAVVIAVLMLQYFRGIPRQPSQEPGFTPQMAGQPKSGQAKEANSSSPRELSVSPRESHSATAQTVASHKPFPGIDARRSNRQIEPMRNSDALDTSGTARNIRKEIAPAMRSTIVPAALESVTLSGRSASSPSGAASSSEVSRIEIQTADPNIRIIWLAPSDSRRSEGTNHDQDPPENGDRN